jgi:hypothetical protein
MNAPGKIPLSPAAQFSPGTLKVVVTVVEPVKNVA